MKNCWENSARKASTHPVGVYAYFFNAKKDFGEVGILNIGL
jgi:hypothetical protein